MIEAQLVYGDGWLTASLPDHTRRASGGITVPLEPAPDLTAAVRTALTAPLDGPPLRERAGKGDLVTIAFDDATVPCYAPLWNVGLSLIIEELRAGGVRDADMRLICANALHRRFTHDELARLIGNDLVAEHGDRLACHDAEDADNMVALGRTAEGFHVDLNRAVVESDLTVYLNCSTFRGFSGGWKSVCVGLSSYRSIHHHHDPDTMSMSLDRNRMHEILDEMGHLVDDRLGPERIFKVETVLANPLEVHEVVGGSVWATRRHVVDKLRTNLPPRRDELEEPADVVLYGVPDWSPYAAFAHGNPILDLISTGLGYLGGVIQAMGKPGCTAILANPARWRWDDDHHPSYREAWERILPETKDPDEARASFEAEFAARADYIDRYRFEHAFHPTHAIMALYPLKRLRHAARVIVAGAEDPAIPAHCGFDAAPTVEDAIAMAQEHHGRDASIALVSYPPAFNRA